MNISVTSKNTARSKEVWILEDDPELCSIYGELLGDKQVRLFSSIASFEANLHHAACPPALLIADLCLPDGNFFEYVCSIKNKAESQVPVMVVSAMHDMQTLRSCLHRGVVDYLTKPFNSNQLLAKVEWYLSQASTGLQNNLPFLIDRVGSKVVDQEGHAVELTRKETQLLCKIVDHHPSGVHRKHILTALWEGVCVTPKVVDVHLSHLRAKLSALGVQIVCVDGLYKIGTR